MVFCPVSFACLLINNAPPERQCLSLQLLCCYTFLHYTPHVCVHCIIMVFIYMLPLISSSFLWGRRGISKFYNGKSRSFTFLKEAIGPSGSAKVIAKAENAYSRKRKNLLAYSIMYDQSQITVPQTYENGISKRLAGLSRLRPLDGMSSNSSSSSSLSSDENEPPQQFIFVQSPDNTAQFASPAITTPRLGSCAFKILPVPMRSFSMVNLQRLHSRCSSVCLEEEPEAD